MKPRDGLLAFSPRKAACIKALQAQFRGGRYLSMVCPGFGLQSVTFKIEAWTIRPLESCLF